MVSYCKGPKIFCSPRCLPLDCIRNHKEDSKAENGFWPSEEEEEEKEEENEETWVKMKLLFVAVS